MSGTRFDAAVVGAGVFGAWSAWHLAKRGLRVALLDAYGAANARASSAGESRIIRMGYGADEIYTRWSQYSLTKWKEFFSGTSPDLFQETGVLWLASGEDARLLRTKSMLLRCGIPFEPMDRAALEKRYRQVNFDGVSTGILEPKSGVLMARRAVAEVVADAVKRGVEYDTALASAPHVSGGNTSILTSTGETIAARTLIYACGAWLGKIFPKILGSRIFPSRQEVFFFGIPAGDIRFSAPALPTWLFQEDEFYGLPAIENRGLKIAWDRHGRKVDPDTQSRVVSPQMIKKARAYAAKRFPALKDAPIVETRVCQYENTSSGDFLIDRHPEMENVWFVGGGSGHGFKHGPAVGEYVAGVILDGRPQERRFSLATKETTQKRAVF